MREPGVGNTADESTVGPGRRTAPRRLPAEFLGLELTDGRRLGDVAGEFGLGVFAGSGIRFADGRMVESVIKPFSFFGGFGGFKSKKGTRAQFAVQQRLRKERLGALNRLGFGRTALTGPRGVAGPAPVAGNPLKSG